MTFGARNAEFKHDIRQIVTAMLDATFVVTDTEKGGNLMAESQTREFQSNPSGAAVPAHRRYLTILFSDLCESTRIAGAMEAEEYAALLRALRGIYADVVTRHGGEIVRIDGDGVTVIFGYPDAHEDLGRRATETAIDLHDGARCLDTRMPGIRLDIRLHTGIHAGLVLLDVGDLVRGRFEMLGDATNVASRLSDLAGQDEIIVSETALGADRHFFKTGERREVTLRGKDLPLAIYNVLGREIIETRFATRLERGLSPLIGREGELALLQRAFDTSVAEANGLVVLSGPAGLGKTRLANEFLTLATKCAAQIHRCYCESYLGARPLQPFLQLLRSIFNIGPSTEAGQADALLRQRLADLDPELFERLAELRHLLSLPGTSEAAGKSAAPSIDQAASLLGELLGLLVRSDPVVIFIDDWQWADDASRQVLDALRRAPGHGLLIILATREFDVVEAHLSGADVIALSPLSRPDAEAAIDAMLVAPGPFLVSEIAEYSGGNPLYLEELCHGLPHARGERKIDSGGAWLDGMVQARFHRLTDVQADLVKAASVIGHMIPLWLFTEITGIDETNPALLDLGRQDFIFNDDHLHTLRFKHGLTRDAIYRIVGLQDRRRLHLKASEALRRRLDGASADEYLEALAYHCNEGGDLVSAARYAERAGDKAMATSALDRAQAQYRTALEALAGLGQTAETIERQKTLVRKFGLACVVDPSRDHLDILQKATETARKRGDPEALAWSLFWLGYINYGLGECRNSIIHCELALPAAAEIGDDKLLVQVRATLGQAHATACEYAPALKLLDEAIEIKRKHRSGARRSIGLAYSISCKAFVLADQGQFDDAYAGFDEAIATLGGAPHEMAASVLTQRSAACLWQGRMEDAAGYAAEGGRIAKQVKARYLFSMARALESYARWGLRPSTEDLQAIIEATAWLEASASQQFLSLNFGWLTEALVVAGQFPTARRYAVRALRRARRGDRLGEAMAFRALAFAASQGHGSRPAQAYLDLAAASAQARRSAHEAAKNQLCAAEIAFRLEDPGRGRQLLDEAVPALAKMEMPWFISQAERLEAAFCALD